MFKINIDGQELSAYPGQTILEAAQKNGIEIPTLCYDQRLKSYGGCGLCVVEIEGSPKLFRACATEVAPKMVIFSDSPRVRASRKLTLELLLSDHVGDCRGPCVNACPAHTDVQGYVGLIANGEYREAVALIKEILPLPASIGRVCPHPCEEKCRRQLVDAPISIANLKYFVADLDLQSERPYLPAIAPETGKKAAIVGAGPAGLTAAYFLARAGHQVVVYEAMPQAGGMLRYGIPEYRLPKAVLEREIDLIEQMGVKFIYHTHIGREISLAYLRRNYDAVFIGIGAWQSSSIRCKGEDLPGVFGGIDFLREVALNQEIKIGNRVAVVGGGNTAIDAARTAVRLGAGEVTVVYRRTRKEMPAEEEEIAAAEEEGVQFKYLVSPLEITAENGYAALMRLQKMELGEPDSSGRRRPIPIPGDEETLRVDTVIRAIGQQVRPEGLADLPLTKRGTVAVNEETLATGIPGVFAGGDGVTGPGIAVEAVAQGKKAAESMLAYLAGQEIQAAKSYLVEQSGLTAEDFADREKVARIVRPQLKPAERCGNFREVNLGLDEAQVQAEAGRCLECGCRDYFECKLISYANQYGVEPERLSGGKRQEKVEESGNFFERNSAKCILCGLCIRVCDQMLGVGALGLVHRGFESSVQPEFGIPLSQTGCIECGECVAVCPTGALVEKYPLEKNVPLRMRETRSVCSGCGIGCEKLAGSYGRLVLRWRPVEGGALCRRGRFDFDSYPGGRLKQPLVRRNGRLVETNWEEAAAVVNLAARRIRSQYGSRALGLLMAPSATLEEAEAAIGFCHHVWETDRIAVAAPDAGRELDKIFSGKRYQASFEEMEATGLILMVGSCRESPVAAVRVRRAVENGAKLVLLSSEETLVDDLAAITARDNCGELIKEVLSAVMEGEAVVQEPAAELRQKLAGVKSGMKAQAIADLYTGAGKAVILIDSNLVDAPEVELLAELALVTGRVDSPRNGIILVTPGANQAGLRQALSGGPDGGELVKSLRLGELHGLFTVGTDPVSAGMLTADDLGKLELLIAMAPALDQTANLADLVLPGSTPLETEGSYLSCDGQIKRLHRIVEPPAGLDKRDIFQRLSR